MREILFRGKAIDGNWYYGVPLVFTEDYVCMTAPHTYNKSVIPETVGQYTGLTDKNGKKIFEGDVVKVERDFWHGENKKEREIFISVVCYDERSADFGLKGAKYMNLTMHRFKGDYQTVIGNIHDNPELLRTPQNDEVRE